MKDRLSKFVNLSHPATLLLHHTPFGACILLICMLVLLAVLSKY